MANYALDLENLRVISAMQELGIVKEELEIKTFDDFGNPHITTQIQKLRFDHYNKLLKNAVTDIRELLKKKHITLIPGESKASLLNLTESSTSHKNLIETRKTLFRREHEILKSTLSCLDVQSQKLPKAKPKDAQQNFGYSARKNYKATFKKYKEKQEENLKKLQTEQTRSQNFMSDKFSKSMKEHLEREKKFETGKQQQAKLQEDKYRMKYEEIQRKKMMQEQMFEDAIATKLNKFETKIKKSEENHQNAIRSMLEAKKEKFQEFIDKTKCNKEEMEKAEHENYFKRIVDKNDLVKKHREKNEEELSRKLSKRKEIFDKKRHQAVERIKKIEEEFVVKSRSTEKDFIRAQKNFSERQSKVNDEMMYRKEMKRLKDLECLIKVQRAKRKFVNKNSKNLQKTLEKYHKIDEFKMAQERQIYTARDSAIKAMIEKEKIQEAVAVIWKSPRSQTAQEKLKELNWFPKEEEVVGSEGQ